MLQHKADQNALDNDGRTPLHLASRRGYIDVVRLLLELGVDVNAQDNNRSTALHLASGVSRLNLKVACLLLEHGADVEVADHDRGRTPLQVQQREEITKLLSESRALKCTDVQHRL